MLLWWWSVVFAGGAAGAVQTVTHTFGHRSGPIVPSTGSRSDA